MSPSSKILTFPRLSVPAKGRLPAWSELDDISTERMREGLREEREEREKGRLPAWSDLDAIWLKDLTEGMREYLAERNRAALAVADDVGGGP